MNVDGGHPEIDSILEMMDVNGDGHISFEEVEGTMKELSKLFGYKIDNQDRGEFEFLWNMMDVNNDNSLSPSEVKKVLSSAPLIDKINGFAQDKMLKAAKVEKDKVKNSQV